MTQIDYSGARVASPVAFCIRACEKLIERRRAARIDAQARNDLAHLAIAAPHCLPDIGLAQDVAASSPEVAVWRGDDVRVVIASTGQYASVSTERSSG